MSNKHHPDTLEKEFELERMILFSDAVFAIAITLLVIDIKWPELPESLAGLNKLHIMKPTIFSFLGFALSFFFIGRAWSIHLRLFRLLRKYDQGLINRNLFFLFFIVIFPFAASGISGHVRGGFMLPVFFYLVNLSLVTIMHYVLCWYVLYKKPGLIIEGAEAEKKYIYLRGKAVAITMASITVVAGLVFVIFPAQPEYVAYCCAASGIIVRLVTRKINKLKPA
jgi:uncharacterized membrane protein